MNDLSPIVLFVYNRPKHTELTLEALRKANLSSASKLIIYSDGLPTESSAETRTLVSQVRSVIRSQQWTPRLEIIERNKNYGLADSISLGVSETLRTYGSVIVLEDDIIISQGFLEYMNAALQKYSKMEDVHQVSGFMVPVGARTKLPQNGLFRAPASWGWGTWARAWSNYNHDAEYLLNHIQERDRFHFDIDGTYPHYETLKQNVSGQMKTWAVRWYASMYLKGGLCHYPARSLVRNIGFDGTGVHCGEDKSRLYARMKTSNTHPVKILEKVEESSEFASAFVEYYRWRFTPAKPSIAARAVHFIRKKLQYSHADP